LKFHRIFQSIDDKITHHTRVSEEALETYAAAGIVTPSSAWLDGFVFVITKLIAD
jgi:hypothetical protein